MGVLRKKKIIAYDPYNEYKLKYTIDYNISVGFENILFDKKGDVWISNSIIGTIRYTPETNSYKKIMTDIPLSDGARYVLSSTQISDSKIAFGTRDGLIIYNTLHDTYNLYQKKDGLINTIIGELVLGKYGQLWFFSEWGISKFDINNKKFYNLHKTQNLFSSSVFMKAIYNKVQHSIYFTSLRGLGKIDLATLEKKEKERMFFQFTDVTLDGKRISSIESNKVISSELPYVSNITIPGNIKDVKINFSKNTFTTNKTIYRHKLVGFDKKWINTAHNPEATYSFLPKGNYYLHVQYTKSNGEWSKEEPFIKVKVLPPFWQSSLAIIIYSLLVALILLYIVYSIYLTKKRVKSKRKEYLAQEHENKVFRLKERLHKDALLKGGTFFERIRNESISTDLEKEIIKMENSTSRILNERLTTNEDLFELNTRNISFLEIAKRAFNNFKDLASLNKIKYQFIEYDIPVTSIADQELVYEIYSGILSIVFKYMDEGNNITVTIANTISKNEKEIIQLTIDDNSKGFPLTVKNQLYSSSNSNQDEFRIQILREMIRAHHGKLEISSNKLGGNHQGNRL
ncbi:MAG: triple tyrosine motif-containing protein [Cyclobacteriaceae bacterium]